MRTDTYTKAVLAIICLPIVHGRYDIDEIKSTVHAVGTVRQTWEYKVYEVTGLQNLLIPPADCPKQCFEDGTKINHESFRVTLAVGERRRGDSVAG
jgi:hypothetical protein